MYIELHASTHCLILLAVWVWAFAWALTSGETAMTIEIHTSLFCLILAAVFIVAAGIGAVLGGDHD